MLGAVIGDIAGSRFERQNHKSKDFSIFDESCRVTDDSILSAAVAEALLLEKACAEWSLKEIPKEIPKESPKERLGELALRSMQRLGRRYIDAGFSSQTRAWLMEEHPKPYGSKNNGAAMRVGPCGYAAGSLDEAKDLARAVTEISHNSPEGIRAAEDVASAIFLARQGKSKREIREHTDYQLDFTIDEIRDSYPFDYSCEGSVPQAIEAFLEAESFEDTIRTAISLGGDSDTLAAISGSIAEAFYGIPEALILGALPFLPEDLFSIILNFERQYPSRTKEGGTVFELMERAVREKNRSYTRDS